MLILVLDFLSERARGLIITLTGSGLSTLPEFIDTSSESATTIITLEQIQILAYAATFIVAILTIISYGYKFYQWCKNRS